MTAEIGILNRNGVALAADSAVTISNRGQIKVLNTANKLFNLSSYEPIGIMVYGDGDYMGTPWDIIIKEYRNNLNRTSFDTLEEYCNNFFDFLFNYQQINNTYAQSILVEKLFYERLKQILDEVNRILFEKYNGIRPSEENVLQILKIKTNEYLHNFSSATNINSNKSFVFEEYISKHKESVESIIKEAINIKIDEEIIESLLVIGYYSVVKDSFINYTGVVFAGYGVKEIFPSIYEYYVSGTVEDFKKYKLNKMDKISNESGNNASINPFAQQEMVHAIITGVDPNLNLEINNALAGITRDFSTLFKEIVKAKNIEFDADKYEKELDEAGNEIYNEIFNHINKKKQENYITPILNMVAMLPKDELANMAETLVNLTSFKRKITMDAETVGGPIDVAVISKTDGFIWMKRKHYFDPQLNYNYFNKNKGVYDYVYK